MAKDIPQTNTEQAQLKHNPPVGAVSVETQTHTPGVALSRSLGNRRLQQRVQAKLRVSQPNDVHEREADRVADEVVYRKAAPCSCGGTCPKCRAGDANTLHRHALAVNEASGMEVDNLPLPLSGGRPLDASTRNFMETRFGYDFGGVRVHTDSRAHESARRIQAQAFTWRQSIVFDRGAYAPHQDSGRHLLAHELTHVIQQGAVRPRSVRAAGDSAQGGAQTSRVQAGSLSTPTLSRRGPARAPVRPPPIRLPARLMPTTPGGRPIAPESLPYHQRYAPPDPFDNSLHGMMYRASVARAREQAIFEGEFPVATLLRGGTAPSFTSDAGRGSSIGEGYHVYYERRHFHILDAIEYAVGRANNDADLARIIREYMPDSLAARAQLAETMLGSGYTPFPAMRVIPMWNFRFPGNFDPNAEERMRVFAVAVRRRVQAVPRMRSQPLARRYADSLLAEPIEERSGACHEQEVPRAGGHAGHDAYARHVTGKTTDYRITSPEGIVCQTDGKDELGQTWEVKTGYRYFSQYGIIFSLDRPQITEAIHSLEEQRARCVFVTARCGLPYAYAFDDREVARFMQTQWGGIPPVYHIPPP